MVFKIAPANQERLGLLATDTVSECGWVGLPEPIIVQAGEAFVAVPEPPPRRAARLLRLDPRRLKRRTRAMSLKIKVYSDYV